MTKERRTMAELLEEIANDPERSRDLERIESARDSRTKEIRDSLAPLIADLNKSGYNVESLAELLAKHAPFDDRIGLRLIEHVSQVSDPAVQEEIVRALGATSGALPAKPLTHLFDTTESEALRYAIANTMSIAKLKDVRPWLRSAVERPDLGVSRQMLLLAVARHLPPEESNKILVRALDVLPGHAALALVASGGENELPALRAKREKTKGWVRSQIGRTIGVIERRLSNQGPNHT